MYIEIFLLDNALMTYLILRLAQALSGLGLRKGYSKALCVALALYSAFAINRPLLLTLFFKLCLLATLCTAFRARGLAEHFRAAASVLGATFLLGGISYYAFGVMYGGVLYASKQLRVTLIVSLIAVCIPALIKKALKATPEYVHLFVKTANGTKNVKAKVDTGNTVKGLSGARVLFCNPLPELFSEVAPSIEFPVPGMVPIVYNTVDSSRMTFGIEATAIYYSAAGEREISCLIATPERPFEGFDALLFDAEEIYR